jgi:AraC-like DNA-binding protein
MEHEASEVIRRTRWFRRYAHAFETGTGMRLQVVSASWLEGQAGRWEALEPFCRALHDKLGTPCSCRRPLLEIARSRNGGGDGRMIKIPCPAGLSVYALPVALPAQDAVLLVTGRVMETHRGKGDREALRERLGRMLERLPGGGNASAATIAALARAIPAEVVHADLHLMGLIGAQLSMLAERFMERANATERAAVRKARGLIEAGHAENLHMPSVARACGMSPGHFSRVFHRETGLTFSTYLARARVANLKELLARSAQTVSEAAFAAGFQSLSQANRAFRALAGMSPTEYRKRLGR